MEQEHSIWVEKYRPFNLENFICQEELKLKFKSFIDSQNIQNLLFAGRPGSGKTTLAKILAKNINCDYLYLNATEDRDMETIKNKVGTFAAASSFKPLKIIILDEATHILQASQVLLLNMMETYALKTRFILTGNYPERLIEPLRSRLQEFDLVPPIKKDVARHVANILDKEGVKFDIKDLATIINNCYPDLRKIINSCQKFTLNNVLVIDNSTLGTGDEYLGQILKELSKPSYKTFNNIRQIIADNKINDFTEAYRNLYDKAVRYAPNREGTITIIISKHQNMATTRLDQEICFMSCIAEIIDIVSKKQVL